MRGVIIETLFFPRMQLLHTLLALLICMSTTAAASAKAALSSAATSKLAFSDKAPGHALAKDTVATRVPLFAPELEELADMVRDALKPHFEVVEVEVAPVPDLRSWGLAAPGLGGRNRLVDLGGTHHQVTERADNLRWDLATVAEAIGFRGAEIEAHAGGEAGGKAGGGGAVFIGAGGVSRSFMGDCNGEMMPSERLAGEGEEEGEGELEGEGAAGRVGGSNGEVRPKWGEQGLRGGLRTTRVARVVEYKDESDKGRVEVLPYDSPVLGFLANMMASDGAPGNAVHVRVRGRREDGPEVSSFTNLIRDGLRSQLEQQGEVYGEGDESQKGTGKGDKCRKVKSIGIGGVFRITSGVVRAHVMRDTGGKRFHEDAEVGVRFGLGKWERGCAVSSHRSAGEILSYSYHLQSPPALPPYVRYEGEQGGPAHRDDGLPLQRPYAGDLAASFPPRRAHALFQPGQRSSRWTLPWRSLWLSRRVRRLLSPQRRDLQGGLGWMKARAVYVVAEAVSPSTAAAAAAAAAAAPACAAALPTPAPNPPPFTSSTKRHCMINRFKRNDLTTKRRGGG